MTRAELQEKLRTNGRWTERAMMAIWKVYVPSIPSGFRTEHFGFARTCIAWLAKGNHLSGNYLARAKGIVTQDFYVDQLMGIAGATEPLPPEKRRLTKNEVRWMMSPENKDVRIGDLLVLIDPTEHNWATRG